MTGEKSKEVRWIKHYNSSQKILLVGEGDFSFSSCLAKGFPSASNMVATSFNIEDTVRTKHWTSVPHLNYLKRKGCLVLYGVDVHDMNRDHNLVHKKFDVIIYNFPHAGHFPGLHEKDTELIGLHKELVDAFFKSAREMLSEGGEVHITHRDDYPYSKWKLVELAKRSGLDLKEKVEFRKEDYPGYHHKRGGDIKGNKTFPIKACFTFKFSLRESITQTTSNASSLRESMTQTTSNASTKKRRKRRRKKQMTCDDNQSSDTVNDGVSGIVAALDGVHLE